MDLDKKEWMRMKKIILVLLCLMLMATGCTAPTPQETTPPSASQPVETTVPPVTEPEIVTDELRAKFDAVAAEYKFEGILYLTHNGKVVYQFVAGTDDLQQPLSLDSLLYMSSVSKQFCAAAILMLRDQGKLDLQDTLEQYFPEYEIGKDITLQNLLSMRSGIVRDFAPVLNDPAGYAEMRAEEVSDAMLGWLYDQKLEFEPGVGFGYSNVNYTLLSLVVEQVSGESYENFIRENIFEPLGMIHSDFVNEVEANPQWGLTYDNILPGCWLGDLLQGCGDIISTAEDMDIWMTALRGGQVICEESYREMTTDHSGGAVPSGAYGYGLTGGPRDGWGHGGNNEDYTSWVYFSAEYGYNFFLATGKTPDFLRSQHEQVTREFLRLLLAAEDAAAKLQFE